MTTILIRYYAARRRLEALIERLLPASWQIGAAILRIRAHHVIFPGHGANCACLDNDAGRLRRLIFNSLPAKNDEHGLRRPTPLSQKRAEAVRVVFGYLNR